jgi:hypothetical protein
LPPRRSWGRCLCFISARGFPTRSPPETPSASRGARSVFDASPPSTRSTVHAESAPPPFGIRPLTTPPLPPKRSPTRQLVKVLSQRQSPRRLPSLGGPRNNSDREGPCQGNHERILILEK